MSTDGEMDGIYPGGSSGHQGGASKDDEPNRRAMMPTALDLLQQAGPKGLTQREICDITGRSHGTVSGALTNLHGWGRIMRLYERRGRGEVYVLTQWVGDRPFKLKSSVCKCGPCEKHGAA